MSIEINSSNTAAINKAIPKLASAYEQVALFVEQTETALVDAAITTDLWGNYVMNLTSTGYLSVVYNSMDITIGYDDLNSVWLLKSVKSTCDATVETL